jgi:hypothetical protein
MGVNMEQQESKTYYVVCIKNENYPASLELLKIYQAITDERAAQDQLIRVIDESGEDYMYPADCFVSIQLPQAVEQAFAEAA